MFNIQAGCFSSDRGSTPESKCEFYGTHGEAQKAGAARVKLCNWCPDRPMCPGKLW